ncbi:MAG: sulfatase [Myxococcales bacterium]|nr:sulfatase [Myxococcales bacterium]
MTASDGSAARHGGVRFVAEALALAAGFQGLALACDRYTHPAADLVPVALAYAALAVALHATARLAARLARPLGAVASLGVAAVAVWHVRELTHRPDDGASVLAATLLGGLLYAWIVDRGRASLPAAPLAATAASGFIATPAAVLLAFHASDGSRWHLLRHNTLLGTPAYYALATPIEDVREAEWARGRAASTSAPVASSPLASANGDLDPRSLVFVLVDTWRADSLAEYGNTTHSMPALDALAAKCVRFADVHANAPWTRPSVASFFTGLLPEEHGAIDRGLRLASGATTLAEVMRRAGYETAAFVANYANVGIASGFSRGFDRFEELDSPTAPYARATDVNEAVRRFLAERARTSPGARPLFLYVHYLDPHMPYLSGRSDANLQVPANAHRAYERELSFADGQVSALIGDAVRALGPSTLVFLTSDHGEEFGEHGGLGHGLSLHPELLHLPAILCAEDVAAERVEGRLEARDFFDLLPRLAARPRGERVESLDRWVDARVRLRRDERYASSYIRTPSAWHRPYQTLIVQRGIDLADAKLVWSGYGETTQVYDLLRDPTEHRDVAGSDRARLDRLRAALEAAVPYWHPVESDTESDIPIELLRNLGYAE